LGGSDEKELIKNRKEAIRIVNELISLKSAMSSFE
jgi:hypothetical protein